MLSSDHLQIFGMLPLQFLRLNVFELIQTVTASPMNKDKKLFQHFGILLAHKQLPSYTCLNIGATMWSLQQSQS